MRYLFFLWICCLPALVSAQSAQSAASTPPVKAPYLQYPIIPAFPLTLPDGHVISKNDLKKNIKTLVFVFSVDCDHCKHLTGEILKNMDKFKDKQILMVTPFKVDQMKTYYDEFNIQNYPNIIMASEPTRQIMYFYDIKYFPGLFVYNKKHQLVKGFEGEVKLDTLLEQFN
jgi:peroxiredoxin